MTQQNRALAVSVSGLRKSFGAEGTAGELKRRVPGSHILLQFTTPGQLANRVW